MLPMRVTARLHIWPKVFLHLYLWPAKQALALSPTMHTSRQFGMSGRLNQIVAAVSDDVFVTAGMPEDKTIAGRLSSFPTVNERMMSLFASSNHIIEIIDNLPNGSVDKMEIARERQAQLTKPPGSLGKLEDIAVWLADGRAKPQINNGQCLIFAGNHGVAKGVSPSLPGDNADGDEFRSRRRRHQPTAARLGCP